MAAHTGRSKKTLISYIFFTDFILFFWILGSSADVGVECDTEFKRFLSNFQIEKFTYMFNSFFDDSNKDGMLQREDIDALIERLRVYRGTYTTGAA